LQSFVLDRVASHGIIVLAPWTLTGSPAEEYTGYGVAETLEWAEANLASALVDAGWSAGVTFSLDRVYFAGHSSGNHILAEYLKGACSDQTAGWIMVDPVDGSDPFGIIDNFAITPGEPLEFSLPSAVLAAGYDSFPGHPDIAIWPACAPEELSNTRFYDALLGNVWYVTAEDYGHIDFYDLTITTLNEVSQKQDAL